MKTIKQKELIGYLKVHTKPSDFEVKLWAKRRGYSVDKIEEGVYRVAAKSTRR
jgi:hypothetical protein